MTINVNYVVHDDSWEVQFPTFTETGFPSRRSAINFAKDNSKRGEPIKAEIEQGGHETVRMGDPLLTGNLEDDL